MRDFKDLKIAVAGTGYVGLSIATLLAQKHQVTAVDVIPEKVEKINNRISPIQDEYIEKYFAEKKLNLTATLDGAAAYKDADFIVIAAPTNYDPVKNFFDTPSHRADRRTVPKIPRFSEHYKTLIDELCVIVDDLVPAQKDVLEASIKLLSQMRGYVFVDNMQNIEY